MIYVITELEIISINAENLKILKTYALPNYFESVELKNGYAAIKCIDDQIIYI
ncbi:hypothetical protein GCM10010967_53190 [Dyadobacter beijingensis]|uniref:Uncharacterized protein n=1 Tax=Dyadobacter beijingensis TaxID=365489 RepID=A0ABQ2IGQ7_9BACT|nr:hypothetical protein GCM10010967_53190 [Dyadobacter beijingensis]